MLEENKEILDKLIGKKAIVRSTTDNDILFFGTVVWTTSKSLDDWPEDIEILPTDDVPIVKDILNGMIGKNIKIGAKDGVGFIYCGKVRKGLFPWLKMKSEMVRWSIVNKISDLEKNLYNFDNEYFPNYLEMRNMQRATARLEPLNEEETKKAYEMTKHRLESRLKSYEKKRDTFVNILNCEVTDIYKTILPEENNATIVLFDGIVQAQGSFCTLSECEADVRVQREIKNLEA